MYYTGHHVLCCLCEQEEQAKLTGEVEREQAEWNNLEYQEEEMSDNQMS
jgi:hypothetical protein